MIFGKRKNLDPPFRVLTPNADGTYTVYEPSGPTEQKELRGLGDVIDRVTTATGMKAVVEYFNGGPCRGCQQRQQNLNEAFPFGSEK